MCDVMRYAAHVRLPNTVYHWARVATQHDQKSRIRYVALRRRDPDGGPTQADRPFTPQFLEGIAPSGDAVVRSVVVSAALMTAGGVGRRRDSACDAGLVALIARYLYGGVGE